ncbi:MAG TPA: acetyl-CoA carboxylase biotin carboxylase subunit [Ktedonobacterales bacterium]|jgi:acetyl-CoA carboxylase biotin carboxylase subunit
MPRAASYSSAPPDAQPVLAPSAAPRPATDERLPFTKVLVANRGEIAVRVIRACRDMGLASVAVYSDADRTAPHVRLADEAVGLGPPSAAESYLNIPKILAAAHATGAKAIHPGYGFLSENDAFADACAAAGLIFVGPAGHIQRALGEKTAARRLAEQAGVPIVPGYNSGLEDAREAARLAERVGYPVLLKAAAGGGGKGIRFVRQPDEMEAALRLARSEAASAFGDSTVYLEKAVAPARHIEVQIFGDSHGHAVHLGERECSIQRRHQKLIEESPCVALDEATRGRLTAAAVRLARAVGYVNAGTVEFLLGPDGNFYFLEVNTRLQVEHPVTEWRTGLDLVREQLRVAGGLPLSFTQDDVRMRGHAIEVRVSAEDPINRFLPATGTIAALREPSGPGVRVDSGAYAGMEVPLYYDPLLAKLICWGEDRAQAIARLRRAMDEYTIAGVRTTLFFAQWLMRHPRFLAGDFSTDFIAEEWHPDQEAATAAGTLAANGAANGALDAEQVAMIAAALAAQDLGQQTRARRTGTSTGDGAAEEGSRWRDTGRRMGLSGW